MLLMVLQRLVRCLWISRLSWVLVRGKYLQAGLHAVEASYVSASSLSAFRAAVVRSVCSCKMPLADTPFILNLLDACPQITLTCTMSR